MRLYGLFLLIVFFIVGCSAVKKSVDNFEACKGDPVCMEQMTTVKDTSYVITKGAASAFPIPSLGESVALVVSNIVAFIFGVLKGRKKG